MHSLTNRAKVIASTLSAHSLSEADKSGLLEELRQLQQEIDVIPIAKSFAASKIVRLLRLSAADLPVEYAKEQSLKNITHWNGESLGSTKVLFKSPIPGELQARLALEGITERFLEYLRKLHHIAVLEESERHVRLFIPGDTEPDFDVLWKTFLVEVAFSAYGNSKHQLPGLLQTFVLMMNSVKLADRGFSKLDIPVVTAEQGSMLAALYYAVVHQTKRRQDKRQEKIDGNVESLRSADLSEKDRAKLDKELANDEDMQNKERQKYRDSFKKFVVETINEQASLWKDLEQYEAALQANNLTSKERKGIEKKEGKARKKLLFSKAFVHQKAKLLAEGIVDPFEFVEKDKQRHPDSYQSVVKISTQLTKTAADQISATKGDIFAKCILEMLRLLDLSDYASLPPPVLTQQPRLESIRPSGDDSKGFCYSCGCSLTAKDTVWKAARFMFERPYQRRQSSANEGQPNICSTCAVLAFVSPIKVSDKSIILRLDVKANDSDSAAHSFEPQQKLKEYIRMLTSKEVHLSVGQYVVLTADRTSGGNFASQKLGKLQFSLAKVASTFPVEVLSDFQFSLLIQSSEPIHLKSRHLLFVKGLMDNYYQSIIVSGSEVNQSLGEAIRYVQQDFPYLAEYVLIKQSTSTNSYEMERTRSLYWQNFQQNIMRLTGETMEKKRAKLYQDVAALTGLLLPFISRLDRTLQAQANAKKEDDKKKDPDREVSKLIEQVEDATSFCYYATLGIDKSVEARLYKNKDNHFIYQQMTELLSRLDVENRAGVDSERKSDFTQLYADDVTRAYTYFAAEDYADERSWKELTYQLKLSLYTRFPRLVRK